MIKVGYVILNLLLNKSRLLDKKKNTFVVAVAERTELSTASEIEKKNNNCEKAQNIKVFFFLVGGGVTVTNRRNEVCDQISRQKVSLLACLIYTKKIIL